MSHIVVLGCPCSGLADWCTSTAVCRCSRSRPSWELPEACDRGMGSTVSANVLRAATGARILRLA